MVKKRKLFKSLSLLTSTLTLNALISSAYAGAFSLYGEVNGRNAGNYAVGAAADAEDASTLYYNPAGLVHLKGRQLVLGATAVKAKAKLKDGAFTFVNTNANQTSIAGLETSELAAIPSFFYANKVDPKFAWGVGVFAPFGLSTDWGESSNARYAATLSKLEVIDISPALAFQLTDELSFGAAFDIQLATVDFNSVGTLVLDGATTNDSVSKNKGTSTGFGTHLGFLYTTLSGHSYGLNYQSSVVHEFKGSSSLAGPLATNNYQSSDLLFSDPISMPAQVTFSSNNIINDKLTVSSTVSYTFWSVFQNITLHNVVGLGGIPFDVVVSENFRDTWRIAGGLKYKYSDKLGLRMGLGYDQTPTNNTDRSLRLPDTDRIALAAGAHYQVTNTIGLDVGWTHFFMNDTQIDNTTISSANSIYVNAGVKSNVDLFGGQLTWQIS